MKLLPFFAAVFFLSISACGVKAPPKAPIVKPEPKALNLNCSPEDPDCDRKDENYVPQNPKLRKKTK